MAKPSLKDGYYQISYELATAIFSYGLGEIEGIILSYVLETQYGWGKRKFTRLSASELETQTDTDRRIIHRAIAKLVAMGILLDLEDNCYQFVKDYESWETPTGSPARRRRWLKVIQGSTDRAKKQRPKDDPKEREDLMLEGISPGEEEDSVISKDDSVTVVISKDDKSDATYAPVSSSKMTARQPCEPSPIEERVELNSIELKKEAAADSPATIPLMKIPETLLELEAWAKAAYPNPMPFEGSKLSGLAKTYPIWWLYEAIQTGMLKATNPSDPWGLIAKILRDWESEGRSKVYAPKKKAVQLWQQEVKATPEFLAWKAELRAEREKKAAQAGGVMHA